MMAPSINMYEFLQLTKQSYTYGSLPNAVLYITICFLFEYWLNITMVEQRDGFYNDNYSRFYKGWTEH